MCATPATLFLAFTEIPDPRGRNGRRYSLPGILALVSAAVASGARSLRAIAQFAEMRTADELTALGLFRARPPSEKAIRTALHLLPGTLLDHVVYGFLGRLCGGLAGKAIAIDGKTARGARDAATAAPHLVSALLHDQQVVIGQVQVEAKTNEIGALPALLQQLDAPGAIFTLDAMHTQAATAKLIVSEKQADYVMTVKSNQPTLCDTIATNPWLAVSPCAADG